MHKLRQVLIRVIAQFFESALLLLVRRYLRSNSNKDCGNVYKWSKVLRDILQASAVILITLWIICG